MTSNSKTCDKAINVSNTNNASVKLVGEFDAAEKVANVYDDIKKTLRIDFVPNMYKAMANNPDYLEISWNKIKNVMGHEGKLGKKTKDIIALTVSIMSGCNYCIDVYNNAVKHNGLDNEALIEIYNVIDVYSGLNRLNIGLQLEKDEKPWYGCGGK